MAAMMVLACRPAVMGRFTLGRTLQVLGWVATAMMTAAAGAMFATW